MYSPCQKIISNFAKKSVPLDELKLNHSKETFKDFETLIHTSMDKSAWDDLIQTSILTGEADQTKG